MRRAVRFLERMATGLVGTIAVGALVVVIIWAARKANERPSGPTPPAPLIEGEVRGPLWGDDELVEVVPGGERLPWGLVKAGGAATLPR
jgi:hypothetical protein